VAGSYDDLVKRANGQPTDTVDPVLQGRNEQMSKSLQANMYAARDKEPGRVIEALQISERQKIPAAFVEKNLDAVKKQSASRKYDYADLVNRSRGTAKFLQDPMNAAAAKDDVESLRGVEADVARFKPYKSEEITIHKEYGRAAKGGLKQLEASAYLLGAAYGKINPDVAAEAVSESFRKQQEIKDQAPSYVKEFNQLVEKNSGDVNKAWGEFTSSFDEYKKGNILNALKQFAVGGGKTVGETFDMLGELITEPRAIGYMTVESLANSFPSLLAGGAAGAAGFASPIPGGAAIGLMGGTFAGSVGVEIGSTIQEELASRNIDVNDPAAVASVLKNPDIMANIKSRAERKGITTAAVDSLFTLFAGQIAGKAGKGVVKKAAAGVADVAVQATGEATSELAGQIAKEQSLKVDYAGAIVEGLTSIGHAVGETGLGVTKNVAAGVREKYSKRTEKAAEQVVEETVKSIKTIKDLEAIDNARLKIRESKNIKDVPSKVKELVDTVTGGDEGAAAYFQIDDFNNYWNRKGKSPVEAAAELMGDGGKAYQEAVASGQLMEMSVGQLIAQTATNKDMDDLITITRVGVDGMTLAEARESFKNLPGVMESLASEAMGDQGVSDAGIQVDQEAEARSIGKDVEQQLMASGLKQNEARTYSKIYESAFNAIAERSGKSARELYDQYNLKIRGPEQVTKLEAGQSVLPEGDTEFNQLTQPDKLIENKNRLEAEGFQFNVAEDPYFDDNGEEITGPSLGEEGSTFSVYAQDSSGNDIGQARFKIEGGELIPDDGNGAYEAVTVDASYRRKGIATELYRQAAEATGLPVSNKGGQTDSGKAFRQAIRDEQVFFQKPEQVGPVVSDLGFYSKIEKQVIDKIQGKSAEAGQIQALLRDVKPEEVKWSGIEEFLKGKTKVDKQELLDFIRANTVEVVEVVKGGGDFTVGPTNDGQFGVYDKNDNLVEGGFDDEDTARNYLEEEFPKSAEDNTKFSQYVLPGGENYREVLLTMPHRYKENEISRPGQDYKSSHFDEANILAHVRLNDRTDADGKKVLFVEEIQSDWHQAGRKKGYKGDIPDAKAEIARLESEMKALADQYKPMPVGTPGRKELTQKYIELQNQKSKLENADYKADSSVPDAPFKKTWHEFALKRILRMAAEGGYERVAWTTGEQQAERYDLSKQIDNVTLTLSGDTEVLRAFDSSGDEVMSRSEPVGFDWSDYIGKEAAEKLSNQTWGKKDKKGLQRKVLANADLKVGGEGMKGFYDNILVKSADKLIKKFGGKVGEARLAESSDLIDESKPEAAKYATGEKPVHSLDITPALKDAALSTGFELFQEGAKGKIRFGSDRQFNIDLLEKADPSTFLHETGHFFLEVLGDMAAMPDANDQVKADFKSVLDWFGVESRDQIKTEQHEMFARGFEAYLMEGKAPSTALKKAFRRFKQWLITVYRQMRNLNVNLTPEVRDVFNRMLATEAEIAEATDSYNFEPMFSDPSAFGFTGKKAEKYLMAVDEAKMAAEEQMLAKVMDGYARKKRVEYKTRRKDVLAEVETQVDQMPQYKVLALLQRGTKPDGSPLDQGTQAIKLDRQALIDAYGAEFVKNKLPRPYIYAREGGVNHDVVASMFGFESGDDMITQIVNLPPRKQFVDRLTDQRMTTEFPDLLADDEQLEAEALNAIHSEKRAELLRLELDFLWDNYQGLAKDVIRKTIRRTPPQAFIKEQAQKILGSKIMGRVRPLAFLAAEKKAAKEAATSLMKGDFETAYTAKEKELLNHELYKEALRLKEQTKKNLDLFKKFFKKDEDLAKSRDLNFVNAGRAVLASYGIGKQDRTAAEYLEELRRYDPEGYETIKALVDDAVLDAGPYKTVTADKFLEMSDAVKGLWDLSKTSKEIVIEGRKIDKQKAVDELTATIEQIGRPKSMVGYNKKATDWEKFKVRLSSFGAILRRVEQWADTMDMGEATGAFKTYIFNPIAESTSKYRIAKKDLIKKYLEMVKAVEKTITREPIKSTELNYEFKGKQELLGALLHVGNESNKAKLLLGRGWATLNADGTLNTSSWDKFIKRMHDTGVLVKADWDFVQNVWGLFEETKTEAQKAHYDMYGFYFNEITANEITTPFGTYKGGYAPAIPDSDLVQDQAIRNDQEQLEKMGNSFMFPTAGKGFTKKRIENYTVPLIMDLGMVPRHIDKVTRFTYIEPRVKDVAKLVFDRKFRKTLDDFDKSIASDMLVPWLQRSARQQVEIPSTGGFRFLDATFKTLRRNTGLNIMTGNVLNTLQQVTGLSIGALEVKHSNLRNALWSYVKAPKQYAADVASKSQFMETRVTTSVIEINNHIDELLLNPSKYEQLRDFAQKHGYFLQSSAQNVVDVIVWGGRYDQAVAEGLSEVDAVRAADRAVRATQGSFNPEDMSAFEVGSPMFRAFTMFYSYFNMQANVLTSKVQQTFYEMGLKKGAGRLMYIYLFGFMVPAIVSEAIMRAGGGDWDEDDDGEYMDDMMSIFFLSQFRTMSAFAPYVGQAANSAVNVWNEKPYDDRISVSPAIGALETSVRAPVSVYEAIVEDGSKKKAVKDMLTVLGLVTGVPVAPLGKPLGYMIDVSEGDANPTGPIDFTRGLITGRPGDN